MHGRYKRGNSNRSKKMDQLTIDWNYVLIIIQRSNFLGYLKSNLHKRVRMNLHFFDPIFSVSLESQKLRRKVV